MNEEVAAFKHDFRYESDTGFVYVSQNGPMDEAESNELMVRDAQHVAPGGAGEA